MTASLRGKTLFISGGSRGIGLAIALRAGRDGANVAITYTKDATAARDVVKAIEGHVLGKAVYVGLYKQTPQQR